MEFRTHKRPIKHIIIIPLMWLMFIPFLIFDLSILIYQQTVFRILKIELVKRSEYVRIDRHRIKSLNIIHKVNCVYCGYANGLLQFIVEIVARTEKYWCGIQHEKVKGFKAPKHHETFSKYNDKKDLDKKYPSYKQIKKQNKK